MSALLNSLQMGFRTLAVTKQSSEVWKNLGSSENRVWQILRPARKGGQATVHGEEVSLEDLRSTRTNVMQRRLKDVGTLDTDESQAVLDMPSTPALPSEE